MTKGMSKEDYIAKIKENILIGMNLPKCRECEHMELALETIIEKSNELLDDLDALNLKEFTERMLSRMDKARYCAIDCKFCYAAVAYHIFRKAFPEIEKPEIPYYKSA